MSFFHISSKPVSRSAGRSAVASAAYRSASELRDERTGITHSYVGKPGVIHAGIILPTGAPDEFGDRGRLWNAAEAAERRVDARTARELEFALPPGLSDAENIALARAYVQEVAVERYGVAADVCIHKPSDGRNPHCHAMLTVREVTAQGLGAKVRALDHKRIIVQQRELLAVRLNQAMARAGLEERVDHRSYKARNLGIKPTTKLGPVAAKMQAAGQVSVRMAKHRAIARENGERILKDPKIALDVLTEHASTFSRADLSRLVSRCTVDLDQFRRVMARIEAHPELVRVGRNARGEERLSTRQMVAVEKAMVDHADALDAGGRHGLSWRVRRRDLRDTTLGPEQNEALKHVTGKQGLALVAGYAGTGKSRMLEAAREAWEASGWRVRGAALSGIAAEALEHGSGIKSRTLASLEYAWSRGREKLTRNDVLVIDEAGMVGSRQMERVLRAAREAGAAVRLVGDADQLQPIAAGSAFRALAERHGAVLLSAVRRQQTKWMQAATKEFATHKTADALRRYEAAGMLREEATREAARHRLIAMWDHDRREKPDRTQIILTHTRAEVANLNELAREAMRASGDLGKDEVPVETERGERRFAVGDRVLFLKNDRDLGIKNGSIGTLIEATPERLAVRLDDGTKSAAGRTVTFDPGSYAHLEHGYATTIHKSQGLTVRSVKVLATPGLDRNTAYVAMTRHRHRVDAVYAREDFREGFRTLAQRLGRDGRKDTTLDYHLGMKKMLSEQEKNLRRLSDREVYWRGVLAHQHAQEAAIADMPQGKRAGLVKELRAVEAASHDELVRRAMAGELERGEAIWTRAVDYDSSEGFFNDVKHRHGWRNDFTGEIRTTERWMTPDGHEASLRAVVGENKIIEDFAAQRQADAEMESLAHRIVGPARAERFAAKEEASMALKERDAQALYGNDVTAAHDAYKQAVDVITSGARPPYDIPDRDLRMEVDLAADAVRRLEAAPASSAHYTEKERGEWIDGLKRRHDALKREMDDREHDRHLMRAGGNEVVDREYLKAQAAERDFTLQEEFEQREAASRWTPDDEWRNRAISERAEERTAKQSRSQKL